MCNFFKNDNVVYVNCLPYNIKIRIGSADITIPTAKTQILPVYAREARIDDLLVRDVYIGTDNGRDIIEEIYSEFPNDRVIIVGDQMMARAYPGEVFAMAIIMECPYMHIPIIRSDKFTVY